MYFSADSEFHATTLLEKNEFPFRFSKVSLSLVVEVPCTAIIEISSVSNPFLGLRGFLEIPNQRRFFFVRLSFFSPEQSTAERDGGNIPGASSYLFSLAFFSVISILILIKRYI
jgi:hypothetical protein